MKRFSVLILPALLVGALLAGCGGNDDKDSAEFTAATYPYSFEYPKTWKLVRDAAFNYGSEDAAVRSVSVSYKDPYDQVTITQYRLKKTLPEGVNGYQPEVDKIVATLTKQAKGTAGDAEVVEFGGVPGYQYVVEYPGGGGILQNRLTFLFKGRAEFQVNCQSSAKYRETLNAGCDQILDSLTFK